MKTFRMGVVGGAMALLVASSCEFGIGPGEEGNPSPPASQSATLQAEVGTGVGEGAFGTHQDPARPFGNPAPAEGDVPVSPVQCVPTLAGTISLCLPAPQTGDRSHGDPQPWQPAPVPQPY